MQSSPVGLIVYDALMLEGKSITQMPLKARREKLANYLSANPHPQLFLSDVLDADSPQDLRALHSSVCENRAVEGLMIKRLDSVYVPWRPKGQWFKWKRDPLLVDAVMMYAQRGHGKRSSFTPTTPLAHGKASSYYL